MSPLKMDLVCIGVLFAITLFLFRGIVFDNMAFSSEGDTAAALSYTHAGQTIKETEGIDPLWMPHFFSGMPTFGNVAYVPHNINYLQTPVVAIIKLLYLNSTWSWLVVHYFLGGVFMFFLARITLHVSRPAALIAAITFMVSPYAIGLAGEGHGSKLMALMYLPLVFLLTHMLLERRDLLSFGLLSAAIGTLMLTNHMQIVYYVFMVIGLYLIYQIIMDFRENKLLVAKKAALFAGTLLVGVCISSYVYLSVYEYSTYSIRGGGTAGSTGGLSYDYATNWSWNPWETIVFLIPSFFGFSSQHPTTWQGQPAVLPLYWGSMPFHTSSVYVGIIPILLSLVALIYRRNRVTIFFAILTVIVFLISFGKHFPLVYDLLFTYLPFFNKFRAPSMILHLIPFTTAVLGAYGFVFLLDTRDQAHQSSGQKLKKGLLYATGGLAAVLILGLVFKSFFYQTLAGSWFVKEGENYGEQTQQVIAALKPLRFDLLWKDYIKFVLIFAASVAAIIAYLNKKIHAGALGASLVAILLVDLVIIDTKFINPKPSSTLEENFRPDATISYLKQQPGLFRVAPLPVGSSLFMDNTFAYHGIQSIGGYSPAKLKIYQTMLDSCIGKGPDPNFPLNMNIINMLNVKYIVVPFQLPDDRFQLVYVDQATKKLTYLNPFALPRAFFVKDAVVAHNQTEVFNALNSMSFNAKTTAVLEKALSQQITSPDSSSVEITEYKSRRITVKVFTSSPALLVLGEVYYPAGWKAYIDGTETEIHKTNYILRSLVVPAGSHEILFEFNPPLYEIGWTLSNVAWGLAAVCILLGVWRTPWVRSRFAGKPREHARG